MESRLNALDQALSRFGIATRTLGGFSVVVVLLAALAAVSWSQLVEIESRIHEAELAVQADAALSDISNRLDGLNSSARRFLRSRAVADIALSRRTSIEVQQALDAAMQRYAHVDIVRSHTPQMRERLTAQARALERAASAAANQSTEFDDFLAEASPLANLFRAMSMDAVAQGPRDVAEAVVEMSTRYHESRAAVFRLAMTLQPNDANSAQLELDRFMTALHGYRHTGPPRVDVLLAVVRGKAPGYEHAARDVLAAIEEKAAAESELMRATQRLDEVISAIKHDFNSLRVQTTDEEIAMITTLQHLSLTVAAAAIVLAVFLTWLIGGSISRPVRRMTAAMRDLAAGKLHITVPALEHRDEVGAMAATVEVFRRNATELDATQRELRTAQEQLNAAIEFMPNGFASFDADQRLLLYNDTFASLIGAYAASLQGCSWSDIVALIQQGGAPLLEGEDLSTQQALQLPTQEGDVPVSSGVQESWAHWDAPSQVAGSAEFRLGERWLWLGRNRVPGGGLVCVLSDITERKGLAAAQKLALEQAEGAILTKNEFLANMSHEIRTPMNAILGMTTLAMRTNLTARQRNYLVKVEAAAQGLLGIINDVLDFSKIEAGKLQFEHRGFELQRVLEHLAILSMDKAQSKGLELVFDVAPDVPIQLVGDALRLGQVLLNLLSNAIKFTSHGEVRLQVQCLQRSTERVLLQFDVRDTGIGIAADQCAHLFAAFEQANSSTTREYGGTGLGLAIARQLVHAMQGDIGVESVLGEGSRFYFTAELGLQAQALPGWLVPDTRLEGLHVLLVDDSEGTLDVLQGVLSGLQVDCQCARSGEQAVQCTQEAVAHQRPFDCVVLDWAMPDQDGPSTLTQLRQVMPTVPVIFSVTTYERDELSDSATALEVQAVLQKPFDPASVQRAVQDALGWSAPVSLDATVQHSPQATGSTLQGLRVLLVEDNAINQELAAEILRDAGLQVTLANNGQQAVDMVRLQDFDAVLMDWQMPVMDGFEATRILRADARFAQLPIIAMTANAMAGDPEKCIAAGMDDHVPKPIDIERLLQVLERRTTIRRAPAYANASVASATQAGGDASASAAVARATAALPEALDAVWADAPGVRVIDSLRRLGGNQALYRKSVASFLREQPRVLAQLNAAWEQGDSQALQHEAHSLKGLAANIGAEFVRDAAQTLEHTLKHDREHDVQSLLMQLDQQVREVVPHLSQAPWMQPAADAVSGTDTDQATAGDSAAHLPALQTRLREFVSHLKEQDSRAVVLLDSLAQAVRQCKFSDAFGLVQEYTQTYQFDLALEALDAWAAHHQLDPTAGWALAIRENNAC